jgi:hypothetical protein
LIIIYVFVNMRKTFYSIVNDIIDNKLIENELINKELLTMKLCYHQSSVVELI